MNPSSPPSQPNFVLLRRFIGYILLGLTFGLLLACLETWWLGAHKPRFYGDRHYDEYFQLLLKVKGWDRIGIGISVFYGAVFTVLDNRNDSRFTPKSIACFAAISFILWSVWSFSVPRLREIPIHYCTNSLAS